jgi:hypothetical protein
MGKPIYDHLVDLLHQEFSEDDIARLGQRLKNSIVSRDVEELRFCVQMMEKLPHSSDGRLRLLAASLNRVGVQLKWQMGPNAFLRLEKETATSGVILCLIISSDQKKPIRLSYVRYSRLFSGDIDENHHELEISNIQSNLDFILKDLSSISRTDRDLLA